MGTQQEASGDVTFPSHPGSLLGSPQARCLSHLQWELAFAVESETCTLGADTNFIRNFDFVFFFCCPSKKFFSSVLEMVACLSSAKKDLKGLASSLPGSEFWRETHTPGGYGEFWLQSKRALEDERNSWNSQSQSWVFLPFMLKIF